MIRVAKLEDAEALRQIYGYYVENTAVSFEYAMPSLEDFRERIRTVLLTHPYLVYEEAEEVLGFAYAHPLITRAACAWSVEVSIYIHRDARGRGVGKALYEALEEVLRRQNVVNLEVSIAAAPAGDPYLSDGSLRFHEKMGYKQVGVFNRCGYKFNRWYDLLWMEKQIAPHKEKMPPFCSFPDLQKV